MAVAAFGPPAALVAAVVIIGFGRAIGPDVDRTLIVDPVLASLALVCIGGVTSIAIYPDSRSVVAGSVLGFIAATATSALVMLVLRRRSDRTRSIATIAAGHSIDAIVFSALAFGAEVNLPLVIGVLIAVKFGAVLFWRSLIP